MKQEESRPSSCSTQSGKGKTSPCIVRQEGFPVNGIFSCGFVREVFDLLSEPITVQEIARQTGSSVERVFLAIHDLKRSGVVIT